jgi:hypothetical protein
MAALSFLGAGCHWVPGETAMNVEYPELDRLVALKSAKEIERISKELNDEQTKRVAEFSARGSLHSGGTIRVILGLSVSRIEKTAKAKYEVFKEVYGNAGRLTPDLLREFGKTQIANVTPTQIVGHLKISPVTRTMTDAMSGAIEKEAAREVEAFKSRFLRDVEIDATSMGTLTSLSAEKTQPAAPVLPFDVFLSFASPDKATAEAVATQLWNRGLKVFFSPKQLQGGDDWEETIREALVGSHELCLIVSHASIPREWVLTEWGAAWATQKRITPILVDCEVSDLPVRLRPRQCVTLSNIEVYADEVVRRRSERRAAS